MSYDLSYETCGDRTISASSMLRFLVSDNGRTKSGRGERMVPVPSQIDEIPELYELLGSRRYSVYILREKVEEIPVPARE